MKDRLLPEHINNPKVPPVKCQGIKTKLIPFISANIQWTGKGKWIEPFLGSGVVAFNIAPKKAILADLNIHIINFYKDIQNGAIDEKIARAYLYEKGRLLYEEGENYYYKIREEFNQEGGSLRFLFLNRANFNGLMRFNSKGKYNVPFGRKPDRFRKAYITKICNQIKWVSDQIKNSDWQFESWDFKKTLSMTKEEDFIYMDPPYIGRNTNYYNSWSDHEALELVQYANELKGGFALSMWKENKYRANKHIDEFWKAHDIRTYNHFYHVGSKENLRNKMVEALVIKKGYSSDNPSVKRLKVQQKNIFDRK